MNRNRTSPLTAAAKVRGRLSDYGSGSTSYRVYLCIPSNQVGCKPKDHQKYRGQASEREDLSVRKTPIFLQKGARGSPVSGRAEAKSHAIASRGTEYLRVGTVDMAGRDLRLTGIGFYPPVDTVGERCLRTMHRALRTRGCTVSLDLVSEVIPYARDTADGSRTCQFAETGNS